jgi:hypothetical protein
MGLPRDGFTKGRRFRACIIRRSARHRNHAVRDKRRREQTGPMLGSALLERRRPAAVDAAAYASVVAPRDCASIQGVARPTAAGRRSSEDGQPAFYLSLNLELRAGSKDASPAGDGF